MSLDHRKLIMFIFPFTCLCLSSQQPPFVLFMDKGATLIQATQAIVTDLSKKIVMNVTSVILNLLAITI